MRADLTKTVVIRAVIVVLVTFAATSCEDSTPRSQRSARRKTPKKPTDPKRDAITSARYALRQLLRSPSFPLLGDPSYGVDVLDDGSFRVTGIVTGKNAFNAEVRDAWEVRLQNLSGDQVYCFYIKVGDDVLMDRPPVKVPQAQ